MYKKKTLKSKRSDFNSTSKYKRPILDESGNLSDNVAGEMESRVADSEYIQLENQMISSPVQPKVDFERASTKGKLAQKIEQKFANASNYTRTSKKGKTLNQILH